MDGAVIAGGWRRRSAVCRRLMHMHIARLDLLMKSWIILASSKKKKKRKEKRIRTCILSHPIRVTGFTSGVCVESCIPVPSYFPDGLSLWSRRACERLKRLDSYQVIWPSLQSFSGGTEISQMSVYPHSCSSDRGESTGSGRPEGASERLVSETLTQDRRVMRFWFTPPPVQRTSSALQLLHPITHCLEPGFQSSDHQITAVILTYDPRQ